MEEMIGRGFTDAEQEQRDFRMLQLPTYDSGVRSQAKMGVTNGMDVLCGVAAEGVSSNDVEVAS